VPNNQRERCPEEMICRGICSLGWSCSCLSVTCAARSQRRDYSRQLCSCVRGSVLHKTVHISITIRSTCQTASSSHTTAWTTETNRAALGLTVRRTRTNPAASPHLTFRTHHHQYRRPRLECRMCARDSPGGLFLKQLSGMGLMGGETSGGGWLSPNARCVCCVSGRRLFL